MFDYNFTINVTKKSSITNLLIIILYGYLDKYKADNCHPL